MNTTNSSQVAPETVETAPVPETSMPTSLPTVPKPPKPTKPPELLDRDHSILAFNERVLERATRHDVPLLERLRYLCIVSSNLDEFFEVRAESHLLALESEEYKGLATAVHTIVERQYALYNDKLMPAFQKAGIHIISHGERNAAQRQWVKEFFEHEVRPLLIPVALDPSHPFPQVANKSLNFIVRLGGRDAFGRANEVAIVKVPRVLPRLIRMPDKVNAKGTSIRTVLVSISSVIRAHLTDLFAGRTVEQFSQFRVTRHSDLAVDEDDVKNLRTALRQGLVHRHYGQAVRLEVSSGCSDFLADFLLAQFNLPPQAVYRVHGPVNLVRLTQLIDLVNRADLCFEPYKSSYPVQIQSGKSLFTQLQQGDIIFHQPFERFEGVLDFLREAVHDPDVLAIKQTIYRTGPKSELMDLLHEAVRRGKEVTVVVELKARFDEEANINWAERLESVGAQVLYGVVGLKTHAKMMLITRREGNALKHYGHLSTGNYNPRTARLYTDISHLTADPDLTSDMEHVFVHLAAQNRLPRLHKLWCSPFQLQRKLIDNIDALGKAASEGKNCSIIAKMNALTDEALVKSLMRAGKHGVQIDLIVRGACMLPAQVPGHTENIRVRSVIGRFLEHSRVFYFREGEREELLLSSADWMNRNMVRRVELAWPITDLVQRKRLIEECLTSYLHNNVDAWDLGADGIYHRPLTKTPHGAQGIWMERYAED